MIKQKHNHKLFKNSKTVSDEKGAESQIKIRTMIWEFLHNLLKTKPFCFQVFFLCLSVWVKRREIQFLTDLLHQPGLSKMKLKIQHLKYPRRRMLANSFIQACAYHTSSLFRCKDALECPDWGSEERQTHPVVPACAIRIPVCFP